MPQAFPVCSLVRFVNTANKFTQDAQDIVIHADEFNILERVCNMLNIWTRVCRPYSVLLFMLAFSGIFGTVAAEEHKQDKSDPVHGPDGNTRQKIEHRLSSELNLQNPFEKKGATIAKAPAAGSVAAASSPILYNGGPIMGTVSKIVLIWYGNWNQTNGTDNPSGQQIIRDAIWGLAQQNKVNNYSGITTGYASNLGLYTQAGSTTFVTQASSSVITEFTQPTAATYGGTVLTDAMVFALVKAFAGTGDPNAIYLVLSSSDIAESSGILSKYCGWHTYRTLGVNKIKYGFIGNPNKALLGCAAQSISPNGNAAADGMVSTIAHELAETVTDPLMNAWYQRSGAENSDMCAWTYGSQIQKTATGAYWNVSLPTPSGGSRNYLLQRQLSVKDSKCYINAAGPVQ